MLGKPLAQRFGNRIVTEIQREFEANGWMFLAFVRLNPVFPTGPLNYVFGLTSINGFTYAWVTFVFLLPASIAVALIGQNLGMLVIGGYQAGSVKTILAVSTAVTVLATLGYGARLLYRLRQR